MQSWLSTITVFNCTSKDDLTAESAVQLCTVSPAAESLPCIQHVDSFQIHNMRISILSHAPAVKPGCWKLPQVLQIPAKPPYSSQTEVDAFCLSEAMPWQL